MNPMIWWILGLVAVLLLLVIALGAACAAYFFLTESWHHRGEWLNRLHQ